MGHKDDLAGFLAARLATSCPQDAHRSPVSRRHFILALGAAGLFSIPPRAFSSQLTARWVGGCLRLSIGQCSWTIDPKAFGANATLRYKQQGLESAVVRLRNATLPGTQIRVDFQLTTWRLRRKWLAELHLPRLGFRANGSLNALLDGEALTSAFRGGHWTVGESIFHSGAGLLKVRAVPQLTIEFDSNGTLDGPVQLNGSALTLQCRRRTKSAAECLGVEVSRYVTYFAVGDPRLRPRAYGCTTANTLVALRPHDTEGFSGECFESGGAMRQIALIDGPAVLEVRGTGSSTTPLRFDRSTAMVSDGVLGVAGTVREAPYHVHAGSLTASIEGRSGAKPFSAVFREGDANTFEAHVNLKQVWLPLIDGDEAVVTVGNRAALLTNSKSPAGDPPGSISILIEGADIAAMALDGVFLTLRRGSDLFNMSFKLHGFEIWSDPYHSPQLRRFRDTSGDYREATFTVLLPPQHIGEKITAFDGTCPTPAGDTDHARFADSSRIVFKFPAQSARDAAWRMVPISIETLTDWREISVYLSIPSRAMAGDDLKSQLDTVGIDLAAPGPSLTAALAKIKDSLRGPADDETSLELAAELLFSPGRNVVWELPSAKHPDSAVPLYGVRIGHRKDPALRAVWSNLLTEKQFTSPLDNKSQDLITLSQYEHWGIVGQTSVYGLPALRRILPTKSNGGVESELAKVPRGGVVRPSPAPQYLLDIDTALAAREAQKSGKPPAFPAPPETGIALATTFDQADITLTALGATMRLDWRGDPPTIEPTDLPHLETIPGMSLERLFYSTFLSRDERVIAADKGFLMPFGFRATKLDISERAYVPDPNNPGGTIAIEIRRVRIVTRRPTKTFPALNQPDGGRDWAASSMTLLTDVTPDLVDPASPQGGREVVAGSDLLAFWPQVRVDPTHTADFEWKTQIENDPTPLVNRMLFIRSDAIANSTFLEEMARRYNDRAKQSVLTGAPWPARNVAKLSGVRRRYADSLKPGDTSFDTDSWLMVVRGRALGGGDAYIMDARMNGADQPPFYPSILRMKIAIQSIDRLVGTPQGLITCKPDPDYVRVGFPGGESDPQIFIDVVSPRIAMDVTGVGAVAGGVAQPKTLVAAISRGTGIVGGKSLDGTADSAVALRALSSPEVNLDFSSAKKNQFSPKEFFNLRLEILGVDLMGCVAEVAKAALSDAAPKLIETISYGISENGKDVLKAIQDLAAAVAPLVDQLLLNGSTCASGPCGAIDLAIEKVDKSLPPNLPFEKLYTDFYQAYLQTKQADLGAKLRKISTVTSLLNVPPIASEVLAAARPLLNAIDALLANPVPQQFEQVESQLKDNWDALQHAVHDGVAGVCKALADQLIGQVLAPALTALSKDEARLVFGVDVSGAAQIIAALRDPSARQRMAETLFFDQFGDALLRLGSLVRDLEARVNGHLALARADILEALATLIDSGIQTLLPRLNPQGQPNICDPATQQILAAELTAALDQALQQVQPAPNQDAPDILSDLMSLPVRFQAPAQNGMNAAIAARSAWFIAQSGESAAKIVADFTAIIIPSAESIADQQIKAECSRVATLVNDYAQHAERRVQQSIDAIIGTVNAALDVALFQQINAAGLKITKWCTDATDGILPVAQAIGDGLLADGVTVVQQLSDIVQRASTLDAPIAPPSLRDAFVEGRRQFLSAAADLRPLIDGLSAARQRVAKLTTASVCAPGAQMIQALDSAVRGRFDLLAPCARMVRALDAMHLALPAPRPTPDPFDALLSAVKDWLLNITTIGQAGASAQWNRISGGVQQLQSAFSNAKYSAYQTKLTTSFQQVAQDAAKLRQDLHAANSQELVTLITQIVSNYAPKERYLGGLILQTVAFADTTVSRLTAAVLDMIHRAASAVESFENMTITVLDGLITAIDGNSLVQYLLNVLGFQDFKTAVIDIKNERDRLHAIAQAPDLDAARPLATPLITQWQGGKVPLATVFDQFLHVIDTLFQGKFDALLAPAVRALLNQLKEQLLSVVTQLVPTKISTEFTWRTQLNSNNIFKIVDSNDPNAISDHLVLRSTVEFDFLTQQRFARMRGDLHAFAINLPNMALISFNPVVFTAGTDQATSFQISVRDVTLGPYLQFLKALQEWMTPSDSGFYVRPSFANIQVGYVYASDLIQVGDLEFINIGMEVYARLPFGAGGAKFGFSFASEQRPFIVSCMPYGGGGYFLVETDASGSIESLTLSVIFGAVVAFEFGGLLTGSGRVVAGMSLTKRGSGLTMQAIFEAVGEGHIACFSLSIYIRITLTHYDNGVMEGQAIFRFTFKVGFFSLSYSVTAARRISGNDDKPRQPTEGAAAVTAARRISGNDDKQTQPTERAPVFSEALSLPQAAPTFTLATSVPVKSQRWDTYRRHVALDLIDDL